MNNRRNFLKILGTGMAAMTAQPVIAGVEKLKTPDRPLRIGLLLPQSNVAPHYSPSFVNGFRLGIDQHQALKKRQIEIITESIGYGTPFLSNQSARKLLFENRADLVTGILSTEVASQFEGLFAQQQVPFIVCNAGENYPGEPLRKNPFLFFNTLQLYQSAWMTAHYATKKYGLRGAVVTTLYDSGYDPVFAFTTGAETAGGTAEVLVLNPNGTDLVADAATRLRALQPDYCYLLMSGEKARDFIGRFGELYGSSLPLLTTPFVTDAVNLPALGLQAAGLESVAPWDGHLENTSNRNFTKKYLETWRALPDLFSILGFETGAMVYKALAACHGDFSGPRLTSSLAAVTMDSPRGAFTVDDRTGWTQTPLYRLSIDTPLLSPLPEACIEEQLTPVDAMDSAFAALDTNLRSGWLNPYLFV